MEKTIEQQKYEEMIRRVKEVTDYVIETGSSTRQTAKYFTENRFKISNATVSVYLNSRLPMIDKNRYILVKSIIEKNLPKTVETVEVRQRIYSAVKLLLQGYTIPQIVEEMNKGKELKDQVTFDSIYDDLTRRLELIEKDTQIIDDVKKSLYQNRLDTLKNQGVNGPNMSALLQDRDNSGKFTSNKK